MTAELVVLDTNIWTHLYSASKQHVDARKWRGAMMGREVVIVQQTRAEVMYGLELSAWSADRKRRVRTQLDATPTIPIDEEVIEAWVELRVACRLRRPRPHPLHDSKHHGHDQWIAATAISLRVPLLTRDAGFKDAPGLELLEY
jgi:predicted nucleic acid-binding protein